jgi:hypothetical protein
MCRPRLSFNLQPGREQYGEVTNVRFTPESGLNSDISPCPLWAKRSCEQAQQDALFDHLVGGS